MRAAYELVIAHLHTGCPAELPAAVGAVYAEHPRTHPRDPCTACRYPTPVQFGETGDPFAVFFPACPLFGGETAYGSCIAT